VKTFEVSCCRRNEQTNHYAAPEKYVAPRWAFALNENIKEKFRFFENCGIISSVTGDFGGLMDGLLKPSSDFVFKNLFGLEKHKKVLVCLLNAILQEHPHINGITLVNTEHKKKRKDGRSVTLDIEAVTDQKTIVDIEIQCDRDGNLVNRAMHHMSRLMKDELDENESFDSMPDIISIWLTDYKETRRRHHTHEAVYMFKPNPLDGIETASEKTRIFIIELPKVDLKHASINDMFSVWMYFLKNPEMIPSEFLKKIPEVHEALEELKILSMDEEFRARYNVHIKEQNDRRSREANAKAEGIAIGEEKGRVGEKKEIVSNALAMELTTEQISKLTGLSEKEILELKKSLGNR
jgi:predicted transposase/invertase (TIGR01784 family)